jgi:uncharacterized protein (TIGR03437 family)
MLRLALAILVFASAALPQSLITTVVGTDTIFQDNGKPALQARIGQSEGVLAAPDGTIYFSDYSLHQIFKVGKDGIIRVVAGNGIRGFSGDSGPATGASLNLPLRLAMDAAGNLYFADCNNGRIRRITPAGIITTVAGNGTSGFSGDQGPATKAALSVPRGVSFDNAGNMLIADTNNHRIRKVTADGIIQTIAGNGTGTFAGDGGPALAASLFNPRAVATDAAGNIYISDTTNARVRKISIADGTISTIAMNFGSPLGLKVGANGLIYIAAPPRVYVIGANGTLQSVAGGTVADFSGDGGKATAALLNVPVDIAPLPDGSFYIADSGNFRIRSVDATGIINTFAGNGQYRVSPDGAPGNTAQLQSPWGLNFDAAGNLYIAEYTLHRIRKLTPDGKVFTVAGTGRPGPAVSGIPATQASLNSPTYAAVDPDGLIYIADSINFQIRRIDANGIISRFAGGGASQADGVPATTAAINQINGLFVDSAGVVYFSDTLGHRVRKVTKDGLITTVAGTGVAGFNGDGVATASQISGPKGVAVDKAGNVYICDYGNNRVRKVTTDGKITTIAGNGGSVVPTFGMPSTATTLPIPFDLTLDASGNIFVSTGNRVVKIANGITTAFAGSGSSATFAGDGGPALQANIGFAEGVAVDAAGNVFLADANFDRVRAVLAAPPSFQAAPATLTFTAPAGTAQTAAQTISLSGFPAGQPFGITSNLPPWLLVSPTLGTLPATLQVTADPGKQAQGTLNATITITVPNSVPNTRTVNVTFNVTSATPPKLNVTETSLSFAFGAQSTPDLRHITVNNSGGGSLTFTATAATSSGGNWLSVATASGTVNSGTPVLVGVRATPGSLGPGVYLGTVTIASSTNERAVVSVTMTITSVRQSIQLSQTGLTFTGVANGGFVLPQSFAVLNTGQGVMNWTAAASTLSGGNWLSISPASGASDAAASTVPFVQVSANVSGLSSGTYYGRITVAASTADNSPQLISVVFVVLPAGSNPGPAIQPTSLVFTGSAGGDPPSSQNFLVGNPTNSSLAYVSGTLTLDGGTWLQVFPATAAVPNDGPATVVVQPDTTGLTAGVRRGVITLLFTDGSSRLINVLLVLTPGGAGTLSTRDAGGCSPTKLLPLISSIGQNFSVPAAWPTALVTKVVDDCGNAMISGSVTANFANGDPPLSLISLKDGNWSATWQPRNASVAQTSINVTAQIPEQSLQGSISISGTLNANADPPQVNSGGVVSAASFGQVGVLAPGSFVSIYGARFADGLNVAPSYPWTTELVGTEVILGGRSLPLYFTSSGQINAVVPIDAPVNTRQQLIVRRGSKYTVPEPVTIAAAQPAVFTPSQTGKGQGYVLVHDVNTGVEINADPSHPAKVGDVLVTYCAGLGLTNPPVADGQPASTTALSSTVNPVTMSIGGVNANVFFSGLAPGFIGLYQVNATMPSGVTPGDSVPVTLSVGGQISPAVTMAVR